MIEPTCRLVLQRLLLASVLLGLTYAAHGRPRSSAQPSANSAAPTSTKKSIRQDDSVFLTPAKDLLLRIEGAHKAEALAEFVEGMSFEENGEMDKALAAYRKVLNVDPGQAELASRVAALLTRQEDFPEA